MKYIKLFENFSEDWDDEEEESDDFTLFDLYQFEAFFEEQFGDHGKVAHEEDVKTIVNDHFRNEDKWELTDLDVIEFCKFLEQHGWDIEYNLSESHDFEDEDDEVEQEEEFYDMFTTYNNKYAIINFKHLIQFFSNYGVTLTKDNINIYNDRIIIFSNKLTFQNNLRRADVTTICNNLRQYDEVMDCGLIDDNAFSIWFNHPIKMFDHWWNLKESEDWDEEEEEEDEINLIFDYNENDETLKLDIQKLKDFFKQKGIVIDDYEFYNLHSSDELYEELEYEIRLTISNNSRENYIPQKKALEEEFKQLSFVDYVDHNDRYFVMSFNQELYVEIV